MKIDRIEAIPVRVPLKAGWTTKTAHGIHATSDYVVIRVYTDNGPVGLGEATVAPRWTGETSGTCLKVIEELLAPDLVGRLLRVDALLHVLPQFHEVPLLPGEQVLVLDRAVAGEYQIDIEFRHRVQALDPGGRVRVTHEVEGAVHAGVPGAEDLVLGQVRHRITDGVRVAEVPELDALRAVVEHVDLAVLVRAHGAGVDIKIRIELQQADLEAAAFKQAANGSCSQTFSE